LSVLTIQKIIMWAPTKDKKKETGGDNNRCPQGEMGGGEGIPMKGLHRSSLNEWVPGGEFTLKEKGVERGKIEKARSGKEEFGGVGGLGGTMCNREGKEKKGSQK